MWYHQKLITILYTVLDSLFQTDIITNDIKTILQNIY